MLDQKDRLVGIISEGDLMRRAEAGADLVRQLANAPPARSPTPSDDRSLRRRMLKRLRKSGVAAADGIILMKDGKVIQAGLNGRKSGLTRTVQVPGAPFPPHFVALLYDGSASVGRALLHCIRMSRDCTGGMLTASV